MNDVKIIFCGLSKNCGKTLVKNIEFIDKFIKFYNDVDVIDDLAVHDLYILDYLLNGEMPNKIKVNSHKIRLNIYNSQKIIKNYDYIIDGSDNFETKFLINDVSRKYKKFLVTGAISKFDGHIFSFDFKNKKTPCIRSFYQEYEISDDILNCEYEGILGTVAGIVGVMQANEILKKILSIGKNLNGQVLVIDLLNLNFRKIKFKKLKDVKKKI